VLIFDPYAHSTRDESACYTRPPVDDYVPVESSRSGLWFALYTPTWESFTLDDVPASVAARIRRDLSDGAEDDEPRMADEFLTEGLEDPHLLKAIFLAGAGGSGKSAIAQAMLGGRGLKVVSTDANLERFMKAAGEPLSKVGQRYDLFTKARDAAQMELRQYATRRLGLIIDGTGWAYDRVATPAKKLHDLGYDAYMVFVTTSLEKALERNQKRKEEGGRFVPDSYVEDAWRGAHRNMEKYKRLFGKRNFWTIKNEKDIPEQQWVALVKPMLYRLGQKILNRPLRNKKGREWLKLQQDPKTRTMDTAGTSEWPKPKPPKYTTPPKYVQKPLSHKSSGYEPGKYFPSKSQPKGKKPPKKSGVYKPSYRQDWLKNLFPHGEGKTGESVVPHRPPTEGRHSLHGKIAETLAQVRLPAASRDSDSAVLCALAKMNEHERLYVRWNGRAYEVQEERPRGGDYLLVESDRLVSCVVETDGVHVQTSAISHDGEELYTDLLPIPLEEKHWRDNPKDFRNRYQITPEKKRSDVEVASIGKSAKNGKWYGWSHRALGGFRPGDKAFPKLSGKHTDWDLDKREQWEKDQRAKAPVIKTDAEARQSAINFADWVS